MSAHGHFVRHDLMTTDPEAAASFYAAVLAWTTGAVDTEMGPMTAQLLDGEPGTVFIPVGAETGLSSHWMGYLGVDDIDAALAKVAASTGRVCIEAFELGPLGRTAIIEDPAGGTLHLLQPAGEWSGRPDGPGTVLWDELVSPDPAAALPFYTDLVAWEAMEIELLGAPYHLLMHGETMLAGVMQETEASAGSGVQWVFYWEVPDADAAVVAAEALGGELVEGLVDLPGIGRTGVLRDSTGAVFGITAPGQGAGVPDEEE